MKFTEAQKKAIEFQGDAVIVAAAGSGKTLVLVEKVAWLVEKCRVPISRILMATFTEKAGHELKKRIAARLNVTQKSLEPVFIGTLHSLAARFLRELEEDDAFGILESPIAQLQKIHEVRAALLELLRHEEPQALDLVEQLEFHRSVRILQTLLDRRHCRFPYPGVLQKVREAYGQKKQGLKLRDFNDLETNILEKLADPALRKSWQDRFDTLFIDEFQDTSPQQWEILCRLHDPGKNHLVVVGDPQQSIYLFRGSDPTLFRRVSDLIENVFYLDTNFRSLPSIVEGVNRICQEIIQDYRPMTPHRPPVISEPGLPGSGLPGSGLPGSGSPESGSPESGLEILPLAEAPTMAERRMDEAGRVVQRIGQLHRQGIAFEQIALLFRTRKSIPLFADELARLQIPFQTRSGQSLLEMPETDHVLHLMKLLQGKGDAMTRALFLLSPFGAHTLEQLYTLPELEVPPSLLEPFKDNLPLGNLPNPGSIEAGKWVNQLFEKILPRLGKLPCAEQHSQRVLEALRQLLIRIIPMGLNHPSEVIKFLEDLREEGASFPLPDDEDEGTGVHLMTVHAAKGLQFPVVFLCDLAGRPKTSRPTFLELADGTILLANRDGEATGLKDVLAKSGFFEEQEKKQRTAEQAEAKRLLYVAMTRAMDLLILPLETQTKSGKRGNSLWSDFILATCR